MKTRSVLFVGLTALLAGCSSAKTPLASSQAPSTTVVSLAQQFLVAAETVDTAYVQWKAEADAATAISQLTVPAATYAEALTTFDTAILRIGASGKTATDIHTLASDDAAVITDLGDVGSQSPATFAQWRAQAAADGADAIAAGDTVRADLGLPPAPGT